MLRCAWLPPTLVTAPAFIATRFERAGVGVVHDAEQYALFGTLSWLPARVRAVRRVRVRRQFGDRKRVRLLAALLAQRVPAADVNRRPPRRSGSAKFTRPSPPKVVPSSENSAWFWLMGSNCPLQSAHPFGAKPKLMILISDRNGSAMYYSTAHDVRVLGAATPNDSWDLPLGAAREQIVACRSALASDRIPSTRTNASHLIRR